jgi:hypothetical protein
MAVKLNRKAKRRFDDASDEPARRERISVSRTRIVGIGHTDQPDDYRAGFIDGLTAARRGDASMESWPRSLSESITDLLNAEPSAVKRERIRIVDVLNLVRVWIRQNRELADVYEQHVERVVGTLEDVAESEPEPAAQ